VRLSDSKIKEMILDTNLEHRRRAVSYFSESCSSDLSLMPLVIQAVEKYGRKNAYELIGSARDLPQTAGTIAWVIDELNDEQNDPHENYTHNLAMVLVNADPTLLLQQESAILGSRHFQPHLRAPLTERLQMLAWDAATCWQKLEEFCEESKEKQYINEVNLDYGRRIVEALARHGDECLAKVHAILSQRIDDYRHNPLKWMEPLAARLAGEARMDSAIPWLVAKLIEDGGDLMNEACAEALARIGTSAVVEAVADAYPAAPRHFRLYATDALEFIRTDLAVQKCQQLLRQENDEDIQINLAHALLSQFASEGIEEARKLLVGRELDFESRGLRNYLLEICAIMGERFPEYDEWRATEESENSEHWKRVKELEGDPAGLMLFALEKLTGKKAPLPQPKPPTPLPPLAPPQILAPKSGGKQRIGRNELCPCGSGKKFKKCCLRSEGG